MNSSTTSNSTNNGASKSSGNSTSNSTNNGASKSSGNSTSNSTSNSTNNGASKGSGNSTSNSTSNGASKSSGNSKETSLTWLALFTTTGTLVCCAIPILLVSLGMGATVAAMVSNLPFLLTLSQHKFLVFGISGLMLLVAAFMMYRPNRSCPVDGELGKLCNKTQRWNRRIYWFSVILWAIGFFAAFLALPLQIWLDG